MVPNSDIIPQFLKEIFELALVKEVESTRKQILKHFDDFKKLFEEQFESQSEKGIFNIEFLQDLVFESPLFVAFSKKLETSSELIYLEDEILELNNIEDLLNRARMEELDVIVAMVREQRRHITSISSIWTRSFFDKFG